MTVPIRPADPSEIDALAVLWHAGWQDAHAAIVAAELTKRRTLERFRQRVEDALPRFQVAGEVGAPMGLCLNEGEELNQLYVSPGARGRGVAAALVADAERLLRSDGVETAHLICAAGNTRAARFYEKCGWHRARDVVEEIPTPEGPVAIACWRYEKALAP